jgi:hypothetical protein
MELTNNASIDAAAAALATAAALPMTATAEQTMTLVYDLARMVSSMDGNLEGLNTSTRHHHGI